MVRYSLFSIHLSPEYRRDEQKTKCFLMFRIMRGISLFPSTEGRCARAGNALNILWQREQSLHYILLKQPSRSRSVNRAEIVLYWGNPVGVLRYTAAASAYERSIIYYWKFVNTLLWHGHNPCTRQNILDNNHYAPMLGVKQPAHRTALGPEWIRDGDSRFAQNMQWTVIITYFVILTAVTRSAVGLGWTLTY